MNRHRYPPKQVVYILRNPATGLIKIGTTTRLRHRISTLEGACGNKLELLSAFEGDRENEAGLHNACASHRVFGEWFTETQQLLNWCEAMGIDKLALLL